MPLTVTELTPQQEAAWDHYVGEAPDGTFFHLSGWKRVIERAFGFQTFYLMAQRGAVITGVMPLTHVRSLLFGSKLVANAYAMYGGPVAADDEARDALIEAAVRLMHRLDAPTLEMRTRRECLPDWPSRSDLYVTFRKPILPDVAANLKAIPSGQSTIIRNRAPKYGLFSTLDTEIDRFYTVYAESVRNLGTPVYARSYFQILQDIFADCCDIVTIIHDGKPVASALNIYFRDEVMTLYVGGTMAARSLGANVFMFWEVMRRACERGYRLFDFGRSKVGTGSFSFKKNWGFAPEPLHYQYKVLPGHDIPDQNPLNPKYRLLIAAWKKLPLPVANVIGPPIVRGLG
jgi:FemAB-related protein (PEP-CTERM system-associated)